MRNAEQVLIEWEEARRKLAVEKEAEARLRLEYVSMVSDPGKSKGTENIELANGYKAKIVKKINYNVDQNTINAALDAIENTGPEGKFVAERLIKWKADLSVTEYEKLDTKYRAMIDAAITTSPGTPTLEIVAPKSKPQM
jgi:hypothetical protein